MVKIQEEVEVDDLYEDLNTENMSAQNQLNNTVHTENEISAEDNVPDEIPAKEDSKLDEASTHDKNGHHMQTYDQKESSEAEKWEIVMKNEEEKETRIEIEEKQKEAQEAVRQKALNEVSPRRRRAAMANR